MFKALTHLVEGISRSANVNALTFAHDVTAEHKFHLLLLILFSKSLRMLTLCFNNLRGSMPLLASALNHSNLRILELLYCYLDDNDIICLGRAFRNNITLACLGITGNQISPHAFSELLLAIQYSAISSLFYDGSITVAHKIMWNEINTNRRTAHMQPLCLDVDTTIKALSMGIQCGKIMKSLPPEFATGQKGEANSNLHETDTHPCLTQ